MTLALRNGTRILRVLNIPAIAIILGSIVGTYLLDSSSRETRPAAADYGRSHSYSMHAQQPIQSEDFNEFVVLLHHLFNMS